MAKTVFIRQNSKKIRKKLEKSGYGLCICTEFKDTVWLVYDPDPEHIPYGIIHGLGYTDETDPESIRKAKPEERINIWLDTEGYFSKEREFYDTVEDFLKVYPQPKQ